MKKLMIIFLAVLLVSVLAGCDSLFTGEYASVRQHEEYSDGHSPDSLEASNSQQMLAVMKDQVASGRESFVIYVSDMDRELLDPAIKNAVTAIRYHDPIGAYAVEKIHYEIGTNTGRTAIAVNITYNRSRSEILRIKDTVNMEQAMAVIAEALEGCDANVVIRVDEYRETDITQKIQDYVDEHPDICMEMPQVAVSVYPNTGFVRVIELTFTYQNSRDILRTMQGYVQPVFRAAQLNVSGEEEERIKFNRMYAFLMERNDYQLDTSITPAYSLLRHGVGDSKAFATVYAAMCRAAGLECHVITGTRSGTPWVWNLICEDGVYYHVDLVQSNTAGKILRNSDAEMNGYVWDYSAYPVSEAESKPSQKPEKTAEEKKPNASEPEETTPVETAPEETTPEKTTPETEPVEATTAQTEPAGE